jgi:hypothetical protein
VAARAIQVICSFEAQYVIVVGVLALYAQGFSGERLGFMATLAGYDRGPAAVFVTSYAIRIIG